MKKVIEVNTLDELLAVVKTLNYYGYRMFGDLDVKEQYAKHKVTKVMLNEEYKTFSLYNKIIGVYISAHADYFKMYPDAFGLYKIEGYSNEISNIKQ